MTNFSIGDLVRPLNETGEGVVSAFRKDGMILVTLHDGFEIPFPPKELVLIRKTENAVSNTQETSSKVAESVDSLQKALYLAFSFEGMVKDQAQAGLSLVNQLDQDLMVAVYSYTDKLFQHEYSSLVQAGTVKRIASAALTEWIKRDRFYLQVTPLIAKGTTIPGTWSGFVKHQLPSLADPAGWPNQTSLSMRALLIRAYPEQASNTISVPNKDLVPEKMKIVPTYLLAEREGHHEIDLHIEELIDDTMGMDNATIIRFQLNHFQKCLDEARKRKLWKFVAIHGVGKGVLRNEIRQMLRDEGLKFHDASFQRYGYGATEVLLR